MARLMIFLTASGDLFAGMLAGVVGADHEDDHLGADAVELAVLNAPDHVVRLVAADAEVGRLVLAEIMFPDVRGLAPALGDGVAEEKHAHRAALASGQELLVQLKETRVAGLGNGGRRINGRGWHCGCGRRRGSLHRSGLRAGRCLSGPVARQRGGRLGDREGDKPGKCGRKAAEQSFHEGRPASEAAADPGARLPSSKRGNENGGSELAREVLAPESRASSLPQVIHGANCAPAFSPRRPT